MRTVLIDRVGAWIGGARRPLGLVVLGRVLLGLEVSDASDKPALQSAGLGGLLVGAGLLGSEGGSPGIGQLDCTAG